MSAGQGDARSFPRRYAATQRFTLGAPRSFAISPDGQRVVFVRSRGGDDPVGCLWVLDPSTGQERCIADPRDLGGSDGDLPPEERARRERARESAGGIVTYATDRDVTSAVFSLGAGAFLVDLRTGEVHGLDVAGPIIAPRLDPSGRHVAFVRGGGMWVCDRDGVAERCLAQEEDPHVVWGLPDFVAAEEMDRLRGYWWAPDGDRLAVARVDENPVRAWHIGDPIDPANAPVEHRYPAAGTPNADVSLHILGLDGTTTPVQWDRDAFPYLADVSWRRSEPLTVVVQSRSQQRLRVLTVADDGTTTSASDHEQQPWIDLIPGFPRWTPDGRIIQPLDEPDTRRIAISGEPMTPPGLQVRSLVDVDESRLVFTASGEDPTAVGVWTCRLDGTDLTAISATDGVADAVTSGDVSVIVERRLDRPGAIATVRSGGGAHVVESHAEAPAVTLHLEELVLGERQLRGVLLLPSGYSPGDGPLPVLLDPYGGPHAQRVLRSYSAHVQSQWFADAGFAVLVVDGRGSPGRGPAFEHAIAGDLATAPLEDQIDALHACAQLHPGVLDLNRVAIKGWSFGGFLAALALLRRPDVFAAAIAGAPVTDWTLYDTHYTERYLGDPTVDAAPYRASSLLEDAHKLTRPLLLIHGLSDDNVVAAHTLRLSRALLEAGRPHTVLPLSGVTHMTPQEVVAENLLHLQLEFLRSSL
jgi:dipeptidyl-peptidase-4